MEECEYETEYVKGKEIKVADCLSRLLPITGDTLKQGMKQAGIPEEKVNQSETKEPENQLLPSMSPEDSKCIATSRTGDNSSRQEKSKLSITSWENFGKKPINRICL